MYSTFSFKDYIKKLARTSNMNLFITYLGFLFFNLISLFIINLVSNKGAYHLNGEYIEAGSRELLMTNLEAIVFSVPLLCLFIATITTLFLNKKQPYRKRFLKGYLLTLIVVNAIFLIGFIYRIILSL